MAPASYWLSNKPVRLSWLNWPSWQKDRLDWLGQLLRSAGRLVGGRQLSLARLAHLPAGRASVAWLGTDLIGSNVGTVTVGIRNILNNALAAVWSEDTVGASDSSSSIASLRVARNGTC